MSAALGLYRLQQVDSQIDQIQARLQTIQQTLENDKALRAAKEFFSAAADKSKDAERALKLSEAEVEKQRIKIEQAEVEPLWWESPQPQGTAGSAKRCRFLETSS